MTRDFGESVNRDFLECHYGLRVVKWLNEEIKFSWRIDAELWNYEF